MSSLPEYLSSISYENPADHQPSLFGYARHTDKTMFEWLEGQPEQRRIFAEFQSATSEISHHRLKPFLQKVLSETSSGFEVAFVDVGGGRGATLHEVCKDFSPPLKGRVVLQDLPKVVEGLGTQDGVQAMPYSFLDPQPVKGNSLSQLYLPTHCSIDADQATGASIYFFRHILHNWPDSICHQILQNTISAMNPNSRILIIDMVIPNRDPSQYMSFIDISMMAFGGMERTETQWRELIEQVGLRVDKIESMDAFSTTSDCIIEASLS